MAMLNSVNAKDQAAAAAIQRHYRGGRSRAVMAGLARRRRLVAQTGNPSLGDARLVDDDESLANPVLVYRLTAIEPSPPWDAGHLVRLANTHQTEPELAAALRNFLQKRWRDDPVRAVQVKEARAKKQFRAESKKSVGGAMHIL